jgi:hypothetical protein
MEALSLLKPVKFKESLPTVTTSTLLRSCMEINEHYLSIVYQLILQETSQTGLLKYAYMYGI